MALPAKVTVSILWRTVLLIACGMGVSDAVFHNKGGFMNAGGVLYYTIQSNLWVFLITAVYLALSVVHLFTGPGETWRVLEIVRFAVLVGITITFLVFWCMLAPAMEKEYLLSVNNILVHTLVPLMFIADFFLFNRAAAPGRIQVLWCIAMPLYYFIFSLVHAALRPQLRFQDGSRYPYFFLDLDKFGWFGFQNGLGVFWWVLIVLGLTLGLGYLYRFVLRVLD